MLKASKSGLAVDGQSAITPPVFSPAVVRVPREDFKITDSRFAQLEEAGGVTLPAKQRTDLLTLAIFWIDDLRLRRTARPKQFRELLDKMGKEFLAAEDACQWDRPPAYHLVHWAMETSVEGADNFPITLAALAQQLVSARETAIALRNALPPDPGRQRPFDDERRIIYLADVFEDAGGKAVAYAGGYYEEGNMADTPFRRFAQQFYSLLLADDKRTPGGLDDALRDALAVRRAQRAPSP